MAGPLEERTEKKMVHSLMNNFSNYNERQALTSSEKVRDFTKQGNVKTLNIEPQIIEKIM